MTSQTNVPLMGNTLTSLFCSLAASAALLGHGPVAAGEPFQLLHVFDAASEGTNPGRLTLGPDGRLYGTTAYGGSGNMGSVYVIDRTGATQVVHAFSQTTDGGYPSGGLLAAADGNLYGTTSAFGPKNCGTIYKVNPSSGVFSVVHVFEKEVSGCGPSGPLAEDKRRRLYGTTQGGGGGNYGVVFKWHPTGKVRILKSFIDYPGPSLGVSFSKTGALFGTTRGGGYYGEGTVFTLQPDGSGFQTVHRFGEGPEGVRPSSPLLLGNDGSFYGTTSSGGDCCGTLYSMTVSGDVVVKHTFSFFGVLGISPGGVLTQDPDGRLYGATSWGGANSAGTLYTMNPSGEMSLIHAFDNGPNGRLPTGGLVHFRRYLYGTTAERGVSPSAGTVFRVLIDPPPN